MARSPKKPTDARDFDDMASSDTLDLDALDPETGRNEGQIETLDADYDPYTGRIEGEIETLDPDADYTDEGMIETLDGDAGTEAHPPIPNCDGDLHRLVRRIGVNDGMGPQQPQQPRRS